MAKVPVTYVHHQNGLTIRVRRKDSQAKTPPATENPNIPSVTETSLLEMVDKMLADSGTTTTPPKIKFKHEPPSSDVPPENQNVNPSDKETSWDDIQYCDSGVPTKQARREKMFFKALSIIGTIFNKASFYTGLILYTAINLAFATLKSTLFLLRGNIRAITATYTEFGEKINRFYNRFKNKDKDEITQLDTPKCNKILKEEFRAAFCFSFPMNIINLASLIPLAIVDFSQATLSCLLAGVDYLRYPFVNNATKKAIKEHQSATFTRKEEDNVYQAGGPLFPSTKQLIIRKKNGKLELNNAWLNKTKKLNLYNYQDFFDMASERLAKHQQPEISNNTRAK